MVYSSGINFYDLNVVDINIQRYWKLFLTESIKTYNESNPVPCMFHGLEKVIYTREYESGEKQIYWINPDGTENTRIVNSKGNDWIYIK